MSKVSKISIIYASHVMPPQIANLTPGQQHWLKYLEWIQLKIYILDR